MASGLIETPLLPLLGAPRRDSSTLCLGVAIRISYFVRLLVSTPRLHAIFPLLSLAVSLLSISFFSFISQFSILSVPLSLYPGYCVSRLLSPFLLAVFSFPFLSVSFPCSLPVSLPFSLLFPLLRFFLSLIKNNPNRGVEMLIMALLILQ